MTVDTPCPKCGEDVALVDPTEDVWSLDADAYEDDAEVWLCVACGWNEEATTDEALDYHSENLAWALDRVAEIGGAVDEASGTVYSDADSGL